MTDDDHVTHTALAAQLHESISRLRADIESRGDPMLEEIAHALDVILELTSHAHDHALENRDRIRELQERVG
jgi:hypothetical protein